jgi:hypothetical protein
VRSYSEHGTVLTDPKHPARAFMHLGGRFFVMKGILATASLALLFDVAAVGQQPQPVIKRFDTAQSVLNVLATARLSGSIEYSGKCGPDVLVPDLPPVRWLQKPYPPNPVDTLRTMFSIDGRFVVSQGSNGIVRVVETGVQNDILGVRIGHLSFDGISNPDEVLELILGAPEVRSFMQAHGIGQPIDTFASPPAYRLPGMKHVPPNPGVKSISGELNDVTLADALDYVLKSFPGFWLYQDCETPEQQRVIYFTLFPVPGRMWVWRDKLTHIISLVE